ncbi:MAG: uroporphyrinogen-III C-methyltransferase [Proteobacteria bacterium]|nr:uroporphyrinogen-III C-methyltransferase [Pseudomonadota bacterium]
MRKKDKADQVSLPDDENDGVEDVTPETKPAPEPRTEPEPAAAKRGTSTPVAWLALLLAFLALATIGYSVIDDWRVQRSGEQSAASLASSIIVLQDRIDASVEKLAKLEPSLADFAAADKRTAAELEALQYDLDNRIRLLDSLPSRMSNLERSIASLQGISAGARDTWLLAEAQNYMQIANAQLQLAGNPHLAALALGMADERIVQLANPALIDVRRAISDELAALEVMDKPDIEGITLTLSSLARVVDSLPLRGVNASAPEATQRTDEDLSGADRAWNSLKGAVSGIIKVTPPDQATMPLIAPESVYFLRTNLSLQLQIARLALLRGETAVFEQSLDDASAWLELYFDTESAQVSAAQQTISEIRDGLFSVAPPDISESLRLLRQFKTMSEPTP